jgi:hypothetical protein
MAPKPPGASKNAAADRDAQLLAAYTKHFDTNGKRPSVRALATAARVGTDAAAQWLRESAPSTRAPEIPAEVLAPMLAPIWAAAVERATAAVAEQHAADIAEHIESERKAVAELLRTAGQLEEAATRATEAESVVEDLSRRLLAAEAHAEDAVKRAAVADTRAEDAEGAARRAETEAAERVHAATLAQAKAEAEAAGLREALAALRPDTKAP